LATVNPPIRENVVEPTREFFDIQGTYPLDRVPPHTIQASGAAQLPDPAKDEIVIDGFV